ncbi:hypothetical protein LO908_000279 [Aeromonas hydrophila]|nr:hypothetical protein [Aeromonas hydrophila]
MTSWISTKSTILLIILAVVNGGYNWVVFTPSEMNTPLSDKIPEYVTPNVLPVKPSGNPFTVTRERAEVVVPDDSGGGYESKKEAMEIRLVAISVRGQERVAVFQGESPIAVRVGERLAGVGKVIKILKRQVEVEKDNKVQVFEIFPIPVQPQ